MVTWGLPKGESFWSKSRDIDFVEELDVMVMNTID